MSTLESVVLGVVQGATEFLPVSSSGHLVLLQHLWKTATADRLPLTVALHAGTALATIAFFRQRLAALAAGVVARDSRRRGPALKVVLLIVLASVPAAIVGVGFGDVVEKAFASPVLVGVCLLATGFVLYGTRWATERGRPLDWWRALVIGFAQAVAVLPGISRSGMTVAAGIYCGLDRREAFEFSFLLSLPAVLGGILLELDNLAGYRAGLVAVGAGAAAALASGLLALWLLRRAVTGQRLYLFGFYCWLAGLAVLALVR